MTLASEADLRVFATAADLACHAADWLLDIALAKEGVLAVCLSGGATPRLLYERLAEPPYLDSFPWSRAHFFWGDERFVLRSSPLSNYSKAQEVLLSHAPVPPQNIHPIPTEGLSPDEAATAYECELQSFYGGVPRLDPARPLFDATLLGLGEDGHTASLFPGSAALDERHRWAVAVEGVKPEKRITLTYPVLESSAHAAFLVAGQEKQAVIARLRNGSEDFPAARLNVSGSLSLFCDTAAVLPPS
jgi:6-phosphogluconolactonase